MSCWTRINLGDAMLAAEQLDQIKSVFLAGYENAGTPAEMAVYYRHESEGRLHCELIVYFSPASAEVATAVGATPCHRPRSEGLDLLAGSEEAWPVLFPGLGR